MKPCFTAWKGHFRSRIHSRLRGQHERRSRRPTSRASYGTTGRRRCQLSTRPRRRQASGYRAHLRRARPTINFGAGPMPCSSPPTRPLPTCTEAGQEVGDRYPLPLRRNSPTDIGGVAGQLAERLRTPSVAKQMAMLTGLSEDSSRGRTCELRRAASAVSFCAQFVVGARFRLAAGRPRPGGGRTAGPAGADEAAAATRATRVLPEL